MNKIQRGNKIPGYNQSTRPEEIESLSKFLGHIKEVQDEHTELIENNLVLPGKTTSRVPKIEELPNTLETLNIEDKVALPNTLEILEVDGEVALSNTLETLEVDNEVTLSNTLETLEIDNEVTLSDALETLEVDNEVNLSNTLETLEVDNEVTLSDTLETLEVDNDIALSDTLETLEVDSEITLSDTLETLEVGSEVTLSDALETLEVNSEVTLSDTLETLEVDNEVTLSDTLETLEVDNDIALSDTLETLEVDNDTALSDTLETLEVDNDTTLSDTLETLEVSSEVTLSDTLETLLNSDFGFINTTTNDEIEGGEYLEELIDTGIKLPDSIIEFEIEDLNVSLENLIQDLRADYILFKEKNELSDVKEILGNVNSDLELYEGVEKLTGEIPEVELNEVSKFPQVILPLIPKNDYPSYKLPAFSLRSLDSNSYLRKLVEDSIGDYVHGDFRQLLIDEGLALLISEREKIEKELGISRDRLPGESFDELAQDDESIISENNYLLGGVKPIINEQLNDIINESNPRHREPLNRPSIYEVEPELGGMNFRRDYMWNKGMEITLSELCMGTDNIEVGSLEQLSKFLRDSPYISTASKFTSTKDNRRKTLTLDSNSNWEIILEPFVSSSLNGGYSYLPDVREINLRNKIMHDVETDYSKWIPFTSFELQKSKLNSKTLNLYEGELMFPVSMEFINEFRITIADDMYKSWRLYFEDCVNVAVYNSEPHQADYYGTVGDKSSLSSSLTAIDKNNICISMYKNITFRCSVYVMNPQYSTIKKFELLLVLRDFVEEASGELDSGSSDLSVTFSVVGENPGNEILSPIYENQGAGPAVPDYELKRKVDSQTIMATGVQNIIKLI